MLTRTAMHTSPATRAYVPAAAPTPATRGAKSTIDLIGATMPFARNTEIFGEGEPVEYLYKVLSGTVRTYKILSDGRRQIGAFHMAGDLFGFEAGEAHSFSAEAITDAKVLVIKRSALYSMAARDNALAQELWALTGRELSRTQQRTLLLVKSAQERIACFLLEMARRERAADVVELPMSRQDIADYLGLTIETVSRTFTQLEGSKIIEVPVARRIVIRNRPALARMDS